ncbi:S-protein homolog 6 [Linum perenne]
MTMAGLSVGQRTTVQVTNELTRNLALIVHCKSGDDDLEAHLLPVGSNYSWSFVVNYLSTTLYWCNLAVEDKRLEFTAFEITDIHHSYFLDWVVKDDGVYINGSIFRPWDP